MAVLTAPRWNPAELEECVEAFETAWKKHGSANLDDFLPPGDHPFFKSILCELVRVDMEFRWAHQEYRRVDDYVSRFPELESDRDLLQQVAYEEYRQRLQSGEVIDRFEYQRRYRIDVTDWPESTEPRSTKSTDHRTREVQGGEPHSFSLSGVNLEPVKPRRRSEKSKLPTVGDLLLHFRIVGNLGDGAFGRVYLAEQTDLSNRKVALKITPDENAEPQMLAELQHANIVPINSVHRFGTLQIICMPYYGSTTLKHVIDEVGKAEKSFPSTGRTFLSTLFDRSKPGKVDSSTSVPAPKHDSGVRKASPLSNCPTVKRLSELDKLADMKPVDAALRIMLGVAEGLVHAHDRGLIHRDLKPANILLADDGTPMLLDFNLAAHTTDAAGINRMRMGGTFPYMAPEQLDAIRRKRLSRDARSDLYSLGVILFELLTGHHPFPKNKCSQQDFLDQMLEDRRKPLLDPRQFNKAIPASVVSIIQKLLSPDPILRYQSAADFKEDLVRQLSDRSLKYAQERSVIERSIKFRRRHPRITAGSLAALAVGIFVLLPASMIAYRSSEIARREREKSLAEALVKFHDSTQNLQAAEIDLGEKNLQSIASQNGKQRVKEIAEAYGVNSTGTWFDSPLVSQLPEVERRQLLSEFGNSFLIMARTINQESVDRHDERLAAEALAWNDRAESCFVRLGSVPDRVRTQRDAILGRSSLPPLPRAAGDKFAKLDDADLYATACDLESAGKYRNALVYLSELVKRNPRHFMGWYMKGVCHSQLGAHFAAVEAYTVCIALKPENAAAYSARGAARRLLQKYADAEVDLTRALQLDQGLVEALGQRAWVRTELKNYQGAIDDLTEAMKRQDAPTQLWFDRSKLYTILRREAAAKRDLAEGMKREPADDMSYVRRSYYRILSNDLDGALQDCDRALELNPRCLHAFQNKAYVFGEKKRDYATANRCFRQMIEYYPDYLPAHMGLGVNLARMGEVDEAIQQAEFCLGLERSAYMLYKIGSLYAAASKFKPDLKAEALNLLREALRKGYDKPEEFVRDHDLDPIRKDQDFQKLTEVARELNAMREKSQNK